MKALTLVTIKPGTLDSVASSIRGIKKCVKEVLIVTGRADIAVFSEGSIKEINDTIMNIAKINDIVTTETMFEVEV